MEFKQEPPQIYTFQSKQNHVVKIDVENNMVRKFVDEEKPPVVVNQNKSTQVKSKVVLKKTLKKQEVTKIYVEDGPVFEIVKIPAITCKYIKKEKLGFIRF